jgi:uncharacterized repeat protein (TIGR01451 family)
MLPARRLALLVVALGMFAAGALVVANQEPRQIATPVPAVELQLDANRVAELTAEDGRMHFFVELAGMPAARAWAARLAQFPSRTPEALAAAGAESRRQAQENRSAQLAIESALMGGTIGAEKLYHLTKVANGFVVRAEPAKFASMAALPGVRKVQVVYPEVPFNSTSVPFIDAPEAWGDDLGLGIDLTGEGISIAIIDSGIDYQHANFGGTGLAADYNANDRTTLDPGEGPAIEFPTAKVVGGIDLAGDNYNAGGNGGTTGTTTPTADPDPMDCNRHGSHVAGSAGGLGVTAGGATFAGPYDTTVPFGSLSIGPGVAPGADLYAVRVFGCQGSTTLTAQAIEWVADPNNDDDFSDHLDIINLSLGSNFGTVNDLSAVTAENASLVGVMVLAASGNAGDTHFITSSPGSGSHVLTVAASVDGGAAGAVLTVNSPPGSAGNYPAAASAYTDPTPPPPPGPTGQTANLVLVDDGVAPLSDGCTAPVNAASIAGNIALMDRGVCNFNVKAQFAQAAGAIGVIIANNVAGDPVPNVMGGAATIEMTIPAISVATPTGDALKAALLGGPVNVTLGAANAGDTIATFSSRGPRRVAPTKLKPEITAPGLNITSTQTGIAFAGGSCLPNCNVTVVPNSTALTISGTSMATPHMAGVMALMRQLHPDWTIEELKALAMNYSNHDIFLGANNSGARFGPGRVGAGRVDVAQAAQGQVLAMSKDDPGLVTIAFGTEVVGALSMTRTVRVVNHGATAQTYDLALDTVVDTPGVTISLPGGNSVTVPAGGVAELAVQLDATASAMDNGTDPTMAPGQAVTAPVGLAGLGALARHRMSEEAGYLTFSQSGNLRLRLPFYSVPRPASQMSGGTIVTGGAGTGTTTIPLSGSDVCTGTLGAGPSCTGTFPGDEVSLVSPFELQIDSPRNSDLSEADAFFDIRHVGVAASADGANIFFGVSSWGDWSSPNEVVYNIWIDNNEDGTWDRVVFNSSVGQVAQRLFGSANDVAQDTALSFLFTPPGTVAAQFFINTSPATADTDLHNSNVVVIAATATGLGLTAGNNDFRYRVETCPNFQPLCSALPSFVVGGPSSADDTGAGFATWSRTARGLDFGGGFLFEDLNGDSLPVAWNTANLSTNGSLGALLLHHHNTVGTRAQVVLLDTAASADLSIAKSMSPATPTFGQNVTFTATVTNNGPNAVAAVSVLDQLPAGLTYVSDNGSGTYVPATGVWTIPAIPASGSASLQIVATVETTDAVVNTATISSASVLDPDLSDNSSSVTVNAAEVADIELGMSVSSPTVLVGGAITFTLTATNNGGDTGFGLAVNELFTGFEPLAPTGVVASHGVYNPATGLWNVAGLGSGNSATLALTFTAPNMAGPLTNNGTASSSVADSDNSNNTASATVTVLSPATVTSTKTVSGTFTPGGTVTYIVTLANSAAFDQQDNPGNELTDVLPSQLTLVSASASSGSAATAGNTVTWNGVVPAGGALTITITATIDAGTELQTVSNQGTTSTDVDGNGVNEAGGFTDDPSVGGAADPTDFVVGSPSALTATKVVTSSGPYIPGGYVSYEVVITNNGASPQQDNPGDEFVDILVPELDLLAVSATSGTADADFGTNTATWNGTLAPGASVTITIEATIDPLVGDTTIANQGTVHFDGDGNGSNESEVDTDDPGVGGAADPTEIVVGNALEIPTLGEIGLLLMAGLLAAAALLALRRS